MALRFYLDTHIAKSVAHQLRQRNIDVIRCEEVGMADASDEAHLTYATDNACIMVSQDDDFLTLAARWQMQGKQHQGIFYVPPHLQVSAQISHIVEQIQFYVDAEQQQALDVETDIVNRVLYL